MKVLKKVLLIAILTVLSMLVITITSKAATTVKITGDTVNVRKGPSTDTKVVAMLSKGVECELLEEEGDWYKIQYKKYTGYVTKQYAQIVGETIENDSDNATSNDEKEDNASNESQNIEQSIVYKKLKQNTDIKILPLIHSSNIGTVKNGKTVIILTENKGWSYIQSDSISGWIRTNLLENSEDNNSTTNNTDNGNDTNNTNNVEPENTFTERTGYINESYVNMRKGAGTSYDKIKVLGLNYEVTIIGEEGTWYKVKSGDDTGYVSKEYVSDSKKVTTRSNSTARNENREEANNDNEQEENETKNTTNNVEQNENSNIENTTNNSETTNKTESSSTNKTESTTKTETEQTEQTTSKESSSTVIKGSDVVAYAKKFLGHKYVYGGDGSDGTFDCSGFTMYVYNHFGISLLHGANAQYKSGKGTKISKQSELKEGDIVFLTDYETGVGIGHCGIYIGNGNFIHASTTTYSVIISSLNTTYSVRFYAGLRLVK